MTKKIIFRYISTPIAWFDRHIVDGTMNSIAALTQGVSFRIRGFQSGQLQKYAFVFVTGAVMLRNINDLFLEITDYQEKDLLLWIF